MKNISYIVVTGWNRKISMFLDNCADSYTLYSKFTWPSSASLEKHAWHTDDILSMVFLPPSSMATSSYSGDIIVLNLNSGKITQQFNPHDNSKLEFPRQKRSIDKCKNARLGHHKTLNQIPQTNQIQYYFSVRATQSSTQPYYHVEVTEEYDFGTGRVASAFLRKIVQTAEIKQFTPW